jgi:hypothetical protein
MNGPLEGLKVLDISNVSEDRRAALQRDGVI